MYDEFEKRDNAIRDFIIFRCNQQTGQKVCWFFKCVLAGDSNLCALQKLRTKFLLNIRFVFNGSDEH